MTKTLFRSALVVMAAAMVLLGGQLQAAETDDGIETAARETYVFKTYLKADTIHIQSENGDVTLTGTVVDDASKSLAQETVASLPGVKSVENKLMIEGEPRAVYTDARLITKIKTTLLFHKNVSADATEVLAKDGAVTLRGVANSKAQRDLTSEYAGDVEGVRSVTNEMTVSRAPEKTGKTTMGEKLDAFSDSIDDASVTALVKTTLLYHRSTSALNTTVSTKDGVVTLGGKAENGAEMDLAAKLVSNVYGVKQVVNNMTVKSAI